MKLTARTARRVTTATAAIAVAALLAAGHAAPAAAPAQFKAGSITWLSAGRGWLLGSAPCGQHRCTDVLASTDGGAKWSLAGSLRAPIATPGTAADAGVDQITFASPSVGWAYQPALYRTTDGGQTWQSSPVPGGGHQVLALAASSDATYAVVSPCREFVLSCQRELSVWRTGLTGTAWTRLPVRLRHDDAADLATWGRSVYALAPGVPGQLFYSATGARFSARPVPCSRANQTGLVQVVPTSAADVAELCVGNPGASMATKTVYRSSDTGRTTRSAGTAGALGIESALAASPTGNLLVGSWSSGTFLYLNHARRWSRMLARGDGGAALSDLAFVNSKMAWAVYGPITFFSGNLGRVLVTRDGGRHWLTAKI
jgi:photosystem II stability/assembly factor-like uncharacterized protein